MSNLLVMLSGSVACYKACDAISKLVQRGHTVRAVASEAALKFVGAATLEGLTRQKVATDIFASGAALEHIDLARWADVMVLCPATANTLNRAAAGLADDLVGALLLAREPAKPLLIAPAMNPMMWAHPATTAAVARLRGWGAQFIAPGEGRTACGESGAGRLAEPDEIVAAVERALVRPAQALRVLVTSGGTAEPIDGVRFITNASTGATGALIADTFAAEGHEVCLLRAKSAVRASGRVREETFGTFAELDVALRWLLGAEDFDAVIHAAAVSDFSVEAVQVDGVDVNADGSKLSSESALTIRLKTNPKLLGELRGRSRNDAMRVIGFKLTSGASEERVRAAVAKQFLAGGVDYVVHNDLAAKGEAGAFPSTIWAAGGARIETCPTRNDLAAALVRLVNRPGASDAPSPLSHHASLPRHR